MKIIEINELDSFKPEVDNSWSTFDGYEIKTDEEILTLLISNEQNCCEDWGNICSPDNIKDFIGAEIYKIDLVDDEYVKSPLLQKEIPHPDCLDCAFINFETDRGELQFAVYNNHNGYYGHEVIIKREKIK